MVCFRILQVLGDCTSGQRHSYMYMKSETRISINIREIFAMNLVHYVMSYTSFWMWDHHLEMKRQWIWCYLRLLAQDLLSKFFTTPNKCLFFQQNIDSTTMELMQQMSNDMVKMLLFQRFSLIKYPRIFQCTSLLGSKMILLIQLTFNG